MRIVVIGNGAAGEAACSAIRSKNSEVMLTLVSEDPNPLYSPCVLPHYISEDLKRSQVLLKHLKDYEKEKIELLLGCRALRIDHGEKRVFLKDRALPYDKLILATGSRPIMPGIKGVQKKGVRFLKSLRDAEYILQASKGRAVIVGSGLIGVELAVALQKRGWRVSLIEALDRILPNQFDEKGASLLMSILQKNGIEILRGEKVVAIEGNKRVEGVITTNRERKAHMVVLAVGVRPNVELARAAGVAIGDLGGIRVDDRMETTVEDVYACGDCVEARDSWSGKRQLSLLWPQAERQGRVAGLNSIGENTKVRWLPDFNNLDIFGTFAGSMGRTRSAFGKAAEIRENEADGRYRCVVSYEGRIAGAQFIGNHEAMGVMLPLIGKAYGELRHQLHHMDRFPWLFLLRDMLASMK